MDLLAAFASDPTALPLWAVLLFACGMYPVGMLFGCQSCCVICHLCCRDAVEQIVVDFELLDGGEQVIKTTPFTVYNSFGTPFEIDTSVDGFRSRAPILIATGQTSGSQMFVNTRLVPGIDIEDAAYEVDPTVELSFTVARIGTAAYAFVDGETLTFGGPGVTELQAAEATVQTLVVDCEEVPSLVVTNPGRYKRSAVANLKTTCLADEGSLVFDVAGRVDRELEQCIPCGFTVDRGVRHPASFRLDECDTTVGDNDERSSLSIAVGISAEGPVAADPCKASLLATVTTSWSGVGQDTDSSCDCETTYTLADRDEQGCIPFSGWAQSTKCNSRPDLDELVTLSASSCFGSGFSGKATEPFGLVGVDEGPITKVEITSGGSGYAVLGRVAPTVSVGGGSGSGADLDVTLEEFNSLAYLPEGCETAYVPAWKIQSIAVTDGGTGYVNGQNLTVSVASPGVEVEAASVTLATAITEPTLTAAAAGGSGADLSIAYSQYGFELLWQVASITVVDGGTGYTDQAEVTFTLGSGDNAYLGTMPVAQARTTRAAPTLTLFGGTGTSAVLGVTVADNATTPDTWGISSVTIADGGAGYLEDDILSVSLGTGDVEDTAAVVRVTSVDGSGAILTVAIDEAGAYWNDTGVIESVEVLFASLLWNDSGEIQSVTINEVFGVSGGIYYEEDPGEPPIVSDVTLVVDQIEPSDGSGAAFTAVVDDDTASETFGQIVSVTIDDGGDGYLAGVEGPCYGVGGHYRALYQDCGGTRWGNASSTLGVLFRRACPDYTAEITLQ